MLNLHAHATVLVLGLGDSGLAMAEWLAWMGAAEVRVWDSRAQAPQDAALAERLPTARRLHGALDAAQLVGVQGVFKSPGLAPQDPALQPLLAAAQAQGLVVQGELDLFAQALAHLAQAWGYQPAVLAITGTNGKTTTTALTGHLCEAAGRRVAVAGNIGPTLLGTLRTALQAEGGPPAAPAPEQLDLPALAAGAEADAEADTDTETDAETGAETGAEALAAGAADVTDGVSLDELDALLQADALPIAPPVARAPVFAALPEVWVLELSSFQLEGGGQGVQGFEPTAATVLNLTQDHLDRHGSMAAYAAAKDRIHGTHALRVVNRDDPAVEALVPQPPPPPLGARGKPLKQAVKWTPPRVQRFGLDLPTQPGDWGLLHEAGLAWLVRALPADESLLKGKGKSSNKGRGAPAEDDGLVLQRLMPADALRIRGRHNSANALAALALATAAGCTLAPMLHALRDYRGEPHRCEWLLNLDGIDFIDDSKGTNVGATVAALEGLGADREGGRLALILGGDGKGQDFSPLREPLAQHARAVALIGRDAPALAAALDGLDLPLAPHDTLEAATAWAFAQCRAGDSVLLSPACASLDMFRNYAHRAEVFAEAARQLATERGVLA